MSATSLSTWKPCRKPRGTYSIQNASSSRRKAWCRPNVGEPGRVSTITSRIAPWAHRTSLASPAPPRPCSPRSVPRLERDCESWTNAAGSSPCTAATSASKVRVKNPRSSRCGDGRNSSTSSSSAVSTSIRSDLHERLGHVEGLGIGATALHPAQPHQPEEDLVVPPVVYVLAREVLVEQVHLAPGLRGGEPDVVRRGTHVAVPLGDLVVQGQRV